MMNRTLKTLALGIVVLAQASNAWACPMCKYALETDTPEPKAYMISILFMMGMISSLFVAVGVLLWWVAKQEKLALTAAGYQHIFENAGSQPYLAKGSTNR
jgi:uncharacterized membrane protein